MDGQVIDILGTKYAIWYRPMSDKEIDGECDYTSKEIHIRSDNYNEVNGFDWLQKKSLRHEIIHAFMAESGLCSNWEHFQQFGHDETTVDWFAVQSPKIFKVYKELDLL